ncbi:hypothetical protein J6590_083572 [Homalodisca vitripennis]|nr:hypothetical protein J6590_083572 [Homalodisca vitripennis]
MCAVARAAKYTIGILLTIGRRFNRLFPGIGGSTLLTSDVSKSVKKTSSSHPPCPVSTRVVDRTETDREETLPNPR